MQDNTARSISTVGIWLAVSVILTFGVFKTQWSGDIAMLIMLVSVVVICGTAAVSTGYVWGHKEGAAARESEPTGEKLDAK